MTEMTLAEVLDKAADIMEVRGLCKGSNWEDDPRSGPVCSYGAVNVALTGLPHDPLSEIGGLRDDVLRFYRLAVGQDGRSGSGHGTTIRDGQRTRLCPRFGLPQGRRGPRRESARRRRGDGRVF